MGLDEGFAIVAATSGTLLALVPLFSFLAQTWRELGWKRRRELRDELKNLLEAQANATGNTRHFTGPQEKVMQDSLRLLNLDIADAAVKTSRRKAKRYLEGVKLRMWLIGFGFLIPLFNLIMVIGTPFVDESWWLKAIAMGYFALLAFVTFMWLVDEAKKLKGISENTQELKDFAGNLAKSKSLFFTKEEPEGESIAAS